MHLHSAALEDYSHRYDAWYATHRSTEPEPVLHDAASDAAFATAIPLYERVIREAPHHPRICQALFYLGDSYLQTGKKERAVTMLHRVERDCPDFERLARLDLGEFDEETPKLPPDILPDREPPP